MICDFLGTQNVGLDNNKKKKKKDDKETLWENEKTKLQQTIKPLTEDQYGAGAGDHAIYVQEYKMLGCSVWVIVQ